MAVTPDDILKNGQGPVKAIFSDEQPDNATQTKPAPVTTNVVPTSMDKPQQPTGDDVPPTPKPQTPRKENPFEISTPESRWREQHPDATGVEDVRYDDVTNQGAPSAPTTRQEAQKQQLTVKQDKKAEGNDFDWETFLNSIKPESPEEMRRKELMAKRREIFASIGDAFNAASNIYFTSQYAPALNITKNMSDKARERFEAQKQEWNDNRKTYMQYNQLYQKMKAKKERAEQERADKMAKQDADDKKQARKDLLALAAAQRAEEKHKKEMEILDATARAKGVDADWAAAKNKSIVEKNNRTGLGRSGGSKSSGGGDMKTAVWDVIETRADGKKVRHQIRATSADNAYSQLGGLKATGDPGSSWDIESRAKESTTVVSTQGRGSNKTKTTTKTERTRPGSGTTGGGGAKPSSGGKKPNPMGGNSKQSGSGKKKNPMS